VLPVISLAPTLPVGLVVAGDDRRFEEVYRPALGIATAPGGLDLRVLRWDPRGDASTALDEVLDALEGGAVVVADLDGVTPGLFGLLAWHARASGRGVLLVRCGARPLPFELRDLPVLPIDVDAPGGAVAARALLAERATLAAAARLGTPGVAAAERRSRARRRAKNGVAARLRIADGLMLQARTDLALGVLEEALVTEPHASDLRLRRALLLKEAGRWEEAAHDLERAVAEDDESTPAWRELGIVRERGGLPGAREALERAVDHGGDYAALLALAGVERIAGDRDRALLLLERAMDVSAGQLSLVLPLVLARAAASGRIDLDGTAWARLETVRRLRSEQALSAPPQDAPWSAFDAATACLVLGHGVEAARLVEAARKGLHAAWEVDPFAATLRELERCGVDVEPLRAALGIKPRPERQAPAEGAAMGPPFRAVAPDAAWFAANVPCATACPVGTDAGTYVTLTAEGRFEEAYRTARGPNPFASVCGRVCAAPCESACRRGRIDAPVAIRALKRFLTERHGPESSDSRLGSVLDGSPTLGLQGEAYTHELRLLGSAPGTGSKVAVIGGGPSGLACAHDLAFLGYRVTLFESSDHLGGMLRHGIPEYRLPRDVLDREIEAILSLGVEVRLGCGLDGQRTLDALDEQGYGAVFLGLGAGRGRALDVEGANLDGVVRAIDFLINVHRGFRMDLGRSVVVVGGGNVAIDVARTARRGGPAEVIAARETREAARALAPSLPGDALRSALGGGQREVHVVARPPLGSWPAQESRHGREEVEDARREGCTLHPMRGIRRVLGENGRVRAVELAEVVRLHDEHGRYAPAYGPHAAETIACDALLLAVGQEPDLECLEGTGGLRRARGGLIEVDPVTLATSRPGVFAGGDAAFGPRTLIEAVAEGKRAARSIHQRLGGASRRRVQHRFEDVSPRGIQATSDYDILARRDPSCVPTDRRTGIAEVELGFDEAEAARQAQRCLSCHVQTVYDGSLCIACGRCVDVCPWRCLSFVPLEDVAVVGASPLALAAPTDGVSAVAMLKDEDLCVRCGLCAERCPTGAMTMERYVRQAVAAAS
jgi:NADPH-dependent glutamate synthase beta subunit-like oxidoreductase/Tfp pilus assembly protein PilF